MPQRDRETSTFRKSAIICFGGLHVWAGKAQHSEFHQQLAGASGTQTIQLREELVLAVAQNASAQATVFEAELKDQLEVGQGDGFP